MVLYLLAMNMTLFQACSMNITVLFVIYLYESQSSPDVDTDIVRNVSMKRLEGKTNSLIKPYPNTILNLNTWFGGMKEILSTSVSVI